MMEESWDEEIIVCLFDGNYHWGVAALINSLVNAQFKGLIFIGYRGKLPYWISQLKLNSDSTFFVTNNISVHFVRVDTAMHLGYFKPFFLKQSFETYTRAKKFYYFDVDIIINVPWYLFSNWLKKGTCLCFDSAFHFLHHTHPWRKEWQTMAASDVKEFNKTDYYFNSGFIGIERESIALIDRWILFTDKYVEMGGDVLCFANNVYSSVKSDQDLLNAAITASPEIDLNIMGKEAMGFTLPATMMIHAIGNSGKPWNKFFLKQLVKMGKKPNLADKSFFHHCKNPIRIFSGYRSFIKKADLKIASFLGRFIS